MNRTRTASCTAPLKLLWMQMHCADEFTSHRASTVKQPFLEAAYPIQKQNNIKIAFLHGSAFMYGMVLENFCFDTDFLWLIPPKIYQKHP